MDREDIAIVGTTLRRSGVRAPKVKAGLTRSEGKTGEGAHPLGYSSITPFVLKLRTSETSRILELLSFRQSFSGVAQTVRSIRMDVNNKRVIGEDILRWVKYDQPRNRVSDKLQNI